MTTSDTHTAIIDEIHRAFEDLGAEEDLLQTLKAWGRSLDDQELLGRLRRRGAGGAFAGQIRSCPLDQSASCPAQRAPGIIKRPE